MTGEQLYEEVCRIVIAYTGSSDHDVLHHPDHWLRDCQDPFYRSAAAIILESRDMIDSRIAPKTVISAIKRIMKAAEDDRGKALFSSDGYFAVCDGDRMVRLKDDILSLPHRESSFDTSAVVRACCTTHGTFDLPDIVQIKEHIERSSARYIRGKKIILDPWFLGNSVYVNPQHLLDMLQALPGCIAYMPSAPTAPIYFKADNGDGVLMPLKVRREE